ncbi:glycosyltransferase family 4 protein [Candidatus Woesearchaeota archaeon]|nr:glycosyltransferase family 4 protein [Candidatus Woesearchaeota archaeon]
MPNKSILVAATTFPRWKNDTEPNFVFVLSRLLAGYGHKVVVLAPHFHNAKKFEVIDGVRIYRFSYFLPYSLQKVCYEGGIFGNLKKYRIAVFQLPLLVAFEFFNMARLIKKEKIDVVHAHWILPQGFSACLCKKLFNVPYVATAHAGDVFPLKNKFFRFLSNLAIKNSDFCTANSSYTKKELKKISAAKDIQVLPMGVDLNLFASNNKNTALRKKFGIKKEFILSVGRLAEKKGIKYLVMAMEKVVKRLPDAKLVIVGDGPERGSLEALAKKLGLGKNIIFAGKVGNTELPKFYASADLFAGPSIVTKSGDTEGLGVVFLEALASGTCVVGSNVGGIPDIIEHNKTGLLVRQKDPNQLADSIIKLLLDRNLRKRLALSGQRKIREKYSWKLMGKKFDELFAQVK